MRRYPNPAIIKDLFFPDGYSLFQRVDNKTAGIKRGSTMRGRNSDDHRHFADVKYPNTVVNQHFLNRPFFRCLASYMVAVNNEYALPGDTIHERDEIAIIPPVSGG